MRMETNTERYDGFEQIFDGVQEYPVDTEYTLPDYCADIQKILKCIVTPEVTSVSAAGDSLTIDGCASMHVLYLDAKGGCVRGFDTKKEFTCSVRLRAQAENVTAEAEPVRAAHDLPRHERPQGRSAHYFGTFRARLRCAAA